MSPSAPAEPSSQIPAPRKEAFVGHANLISRLTILSRIFGLVRDKLCSTYLGLGTEWSAFWMGFLIPNLFRRIFGEGALTAIFVPAYTRILQERGQKEANRLASATCTLLIVVLGGITLLGEAILLPLIFSHHMKPENALAASMIAIMLPYCLLVCLVALLGAIASVHERFAAQAMSPIVLNVLMALAAALPVWFFSKNFPVQTRIYFVAFAVMAAGIIQFLQMLPSMYKSGVSLRALWDVKNDGVVEIIKAMLPMMIGLSAVQFNTFMDSQIAWWLSPDGHGGVSHFQFLGHLINTPMRDGALAKFSVAQRIYMLPVGIFGVAMATAIFPKFSKAAAAKDIPELKRLLVLGLRKTLFLSLPASFGMILIAKPLITLIYSGGRVHQDSIDRATWATYWFCAGVWAFEMQLVLLRAFYAMRDTITPMKLSVAMVLLNFSLNITLVWFMQEGGLAASTTIAAIVQSAILLGILRRRLGRLEIKQLSKSIAKGLLGCAIMLAVALPVLWGLPHLPEKHSARFWLIAALQLAVTIVVAASVYGAVAWVLKVPELEEIPLFRRLVRGKLQRI